MIVLNGAKILKSPNLHLWFIRIVQLREVMDVLTAVPHINPIAILTCFITCNQRNIPLTSSYIYIYTAFMPAPLQITIPLPCSQPWNEMTVNDRGRHCAHCNETVIDFTGWTDTQLHRFFAEGNNNVCGRFSAAQLNRTIAIPHQPHSKLYRLTAALGLAIVTAALAPGKAHARPPFRWQLVVQQQDTTNKAVRHTAYLKGIITDDKHEPLVSVSITLTQNGQPRSGILTDYDGYYSIGDLLPGSYDMKVSGGGYKPQTMKLLINGDSVTHNVVLETLPDDQRKIIYMRYGRPAIRKP